MKEEDLKKEIAILKANKHNKGVTYEFNKKNLIRAQAELKGFLAGQNSQKEKDLEMIEEWFKDLMKKTEIYTDPQILDDVEIMRLKQKIKGKEDGRT